MCFQHRFETFQRQFWNSNVLGQWVPNNRSGDTEASRPEATGLGSRHSQVAPHSRPQMSPGADLPDRIAGAAEVCRTSTMDGVADEDRDLEFDPLTNGKPVELVPQHRSDMVELPLVRDQPGSRVEDRLQSSHDNVCGTVKNTVAVVDTTWYERMDQCFRGIRGEWSSDGSQLSQLIETASSDVVYMQVHSQFTVECHAEILGGGRRFDTVFTDCHGLCVDLRQLLSGSKPQELSLVGVQFQPIWLHPSLDSFNAFGQSKSGSRLVGGKAMEIKLAIVGIGVSSNTKWCGNGDDIWGVQDEEERSQDWTLCGTPYFSWIRADWWPLKVTDCCRPWINDEIHASAVPPTPYDFCSLVRRMSWSTVSKAALRSSNPSSVTWAESAASRISEKILRRAVSVECPCL